MAFFTETNAWPVKRVFGHDLYISSEERTRPGDKARFQAFVARENFGAVVDLLDLEVKLPTLAIHRAWRGEPVTQEGVRLASLARPTDEKPYCWFAPDVVKQAVLSDDQLAVLGMLAQSRGCKILVQCDGEPAKAATLAATLALCFYARDHVSSESNLDDAFQRFLTDSELKLDDHSRLWVLRIAKTVHQYVVEQLNQPEETVSQLSQP